MHRGQLGRGRALLDRRRRGGVRTAGAVGSFTRTPSAEIPNERHTFSLAGGGRRYAQLELPPGHCPARIERYDECLEALRAIADASKPEVVLLMANPLLARLADDRSFPTCSPTPAPSPKSIANAAVARSKAPSGVSGAATDSAVFAECTDALSSTCKTCGGPLTPLKRP